MKLQHLFSNLFPKAELEHSLRCCMRKEDTKYILRFSRCVCYTQEIKTFRALHGSEFGNIQRKHLVEQHLRDKLFSLSLMVSQLLHQSYPSLLALSHHVRLTREKPCPYWRAQRVTFVVTNLLSQNLQLHFVVANRSAILSRGSLIAIRKLIC